MVIPVDDPDGGQILQVIEKRSDGTLDIRNVALVRFVPLLRPN
jgi:protein-L-isoaspartate O-methyltransferase